MKSNIDKQVKSDILGVATTEVERKQTQADNVLNAVTKFGAQLGLSGTGMQAISNYLSAFKNPKDAIAGMLADLKNPNSSLYKEVGKVEAMRIAAASAELALKKLTAEAALTRAGAAQTTAEAKALAAANTEAKPVTLTAQQAALSASLGLGSNDDKFVKDNFTTLLNAVLYQKPVQLPSGKVLQ